MTPIVNFLPSESIFSLTSKSRNIWQSLHCRRQLSIIIFTIIINIRPIGQGRGAITQFKRQSWPHVAIGAPGPGLPGPQSPPIRPLTAIAAPGPGSLPSSNKCVRYWGSLRRILNLFRQSTHLITHLCTPLQLCICSKSKSMESFENLLGPDAASGRAAILAPGIGAPGPRSPPCLCQAAIGAPELRAGAPIAQNHLKQVSGILDVLFLASGA